MKFIWHSTEFSCARCVWQKLTIYPNPIARGPRSTGPNAAASVASAEGRPCVCDTSYTDYFYNWCGTTHVCSQWIQHSDCTFKS